MFITFEGIDGSGKTTQISMLAQWLRLRKYEVVLTREPGGTRIGEVVRNLLLDMDSKEIVPATEVLLFSAARAQLVSEVIRPALNHGKIVLCDRFFDSTFAYQGYGRLQELLSLRQVTQYATGGLIPNATVYLDLPASEGLRRRQGGNTNRLDKQNLPYYQRVQAGYRELINRTNLRWVSFDAMQERHELHEEIAEHFQEVLR